MKDRYYFGTLARQVDYFAFPRTGSHFFNYCTAGLFDLVALPGRGIDTPEVVERQRELDPMVLYALGLREEGAPHDPVFINQVAAGQHGDPVMGGHPVVIMIRDPMATVYSFYRVSRDRWGASIPDAAKWASAKLRRYEEFYAKALTVLAEHPRRTLLMRYEELTAGPDPLRQLVEFVGARPKLGPEFVHRMTRFDTMTRGGEARTFYRAGDNEAWRRDEAWLEVLKRATVPDMSRFGYGAPEGKKIAARGAGAPVVVPDLGAAGPDAQGPRGRLAALASTADLESPRFREFMERLNAFSGPLGLRTFTTWSKVWEYPWIWLHALSRVDLRGARVLDLGSELSPMPWVLALHGARVTMAETDARFVPLWTRLRERLRVDVDWTIVTDERLPMADAECDVVLSFSVIEHQRDKRGAVGEALRVLRPGGCFALSFDICEPAMGMTFPEWNGRALTMREFEEEIWQRPEFGPPSPLMWDTGSIPGFLAWHRTTAPHHNYVAGAAVLYREPAGVPAASRS